jgi:hypothetical protein
MCWISSINGFLCALLKSLEGSDNAWCLLAYIIYIFWTQNDFSLTEFDVTSLDRVLNLDKSKNLVTFVNTSLAHALNFG